MMRISWSVSTRVWIQDYAQNPFPTTKNELLLAVSNSKLQQTVTAVDTQSMLNKITNVQLNVKCFYCMNFKFSFYTFAR